jgi:protein disulfide-isomerase
MPIYSTNPVLLALSSACVTLSLVSGTVFGSTQISPTGSTASAGEHAVAGSLIPWHKGSVESAFEVAKKSHKPLFLYWGAVWCPPCNEIKSQLFSKPQFSQLMDQVVPVYLDGDSSAAQIWGEKLKISGYPTLLLLTSQGQEVLRFNETANFLEFQSSFENALQSLKPFSDTFQRVLQSSKAHPASLADWKMVAQFNWEDPSVDLGLTDSERLFAQMKLFREIPKELLAERALIAGSLLEFASHQNPKESAPEVKNLIQYIKANPKEYLDALFLNSKTILSARRFLIYSTKEILEFVAPESQNQENLLHQQKLATTWQNALESIHRSSQVSADTKLSSLIAMIALEPILYKPTSSKPNSSKPTSETESPEVKPTPALLARVKKEVHGALSQKRSSFERHTLVTTAAYLLQKAGEVNEARELLKKELKTSIAPWYLESSLAALEEDAKNVPESLRWSEESLKQVPGTSSKLQWLASDIMRNLKHLTHPNVKELALSEKIRVKLEVYYSMAMSFSDGFSGRNAGRQKKLASKLGPWLEIGDHKEWIGNVSAKCETLSSSSQQAPCRAHFASALKAKGQM